MSLTQTIAPGRLDFSADDADGFGAYHDLDSSGTTVAWTEGPFRAAVTAHRFPRMLLSNRRVAGASHHRSASAATGSTISTCRC